MPKNLWNQDQPDFQQKEVLIRAVDAVISGSGPGFEPNALADLVKRSRLLASDRTIANIFGGNTSVKVIQTDHVGRAISVLWVKGSGIDMAYCTSADFAGLKLDEVLPLMERDSLSDEEMVTYLNRCVFEPGRPRQSIDALLHAFIPYPHVDHTHPDAIIALACAARGEAAAREVFGDAMVWAEYMRSGFTLSKQIGLALRANPQATCVIMGKHGLITWGQDSKYCYDNTIAIIQKAEDALNAAQRRTFTGVDVPALLAEQRSSLAAQIMPIVRGAVSARQKQVVRFDDSEAVLKFVGTAKAKALSQVGAVCPDHLVHTKRVPLFVDWKPKSEDNEFDTLKTAVREGLSRYQSNYTDYFALHNNSNSPNPSDPGSDLRMADPSPRVILVPGVGMFTIGRDVAAAEISRQLYQRAIAVMDLAERMEESDTFSSLTPKEAFNVEYGSLELYKLSLRPPDGELTGRVALVTGAANGIGRAIALRLAQEGAHVVIADIAMDGAKTTADDIIKAHGPRRALAVKCNVTREDEVIDTFKSAVLAYGGVDIVVNNAGIFLGNPIEQTSLEDWQRLSDVLGTGYFLIAREAFRVFRAQARGGSTIFIGSKNSVFPGKNVSAYSAAKAAELHMARCLAEEGGATGIRVNTILPDAVVRGSGIWDSGAREQRARNYGIKPDELEDYYRARTTLKVSIYPEDVAEAALYFASDKSLKTTGAILTVDGGVAGAYSR